VSDRRAKVEATDLRCSGATAENCVPVPLARLDALCDPQRARVELSAWSLACLKFGISEAELRESMRSVEAEIKSAREAGDGHFEHDA
jgi:hypothetical protein